MREPRQRHVRRLIVAGFACATAAVLVDERIWDYRHRRLVTTLSSVGADSIGGIFGWPIGQELVAKLSRDLTDDEWQHLNAALRGRPRNTHVALRFPKGVLNETRRKELRAIGIWASDAD